MIYPLLTHPQLLATLRNVLLPVAYLRWRILKSDFSFGNEKFCPGLKRLQAVVSSLKKSP